VSSDPAPRYAVYYAPPEGSPLDRFGRAWLGRDAATGADVEPPTLPGLDRARWREITAEPRRYGFHGTLKPPFALADGRQADDLLAAVAGFAAGRAGFVLPPLRLARLSGFLALIPSMPSEPLAALAADCVRTFDAFRAPPGEAELARRRRAGLDPRQEANLLRWGYPYVMEDFRFHLTLTCRLGPDEADRVERGLERLVAPLLKAPFVVDAITVFEEAAPGEPFLRIARLPFER